MNNHGRLASVLALVATAASPAAAQTTIDAGRGAVPLTVPSRYDASVPTPLVVSLHGYSGNGAQHDRSWRIGELAEKYGYLAISPDGEHETGGQGNRFWNASDACCNFYASQNDDSGYLLRIIQQIQAEYNVDPARIYVIGHSNGGFMAYRMAYDHSDVIAAIVSLAGETHLEDRDPPPFPVHVLEVHGTDDGTIAYNGGEIQGKRYPSAMASVTRWARYDGCDMTRSEREMRDLDASLPGFESGVMKMNSGCKDGGSAELWTISDGGHVPVYSGTWGEQVVEWLLAHPKPQHLVQ